MLRVRNPEMLKHTSLPVSLAIEIGVHCGFIYPYSDPGGDFRFGKSLNTRFALFFMRESAPAFLYIQDHF